MRIARFLMLTSLVYCLFEFERAFVRAGKAYLKRVEIFKETSKISSYFCPMYGDISSFFDSMVDKIELLVEAYDTALSEFDCGMLPAKLFYDRVNLLLIELKIKSETISFLIKELCGKFAAPVGLGLKLAKRLVSSGCTIN